MLWGAPFISGKTVATSKQGLRLIASDAMPLSRLVDKSKKQVYTDRILSSYRYILATIWK
jgi:hypothetical protein